MTTREEACRAAGAAFAEGLILRDSLPVEEAARIAYTPGGKSIEEIKALILERRAANARRSA